MNTNSKQVPTIKRMSQQLKCNCYINGERKPKTDRKTCTDIKTHIWNKQVEDHFGFAEESDEEESDEEECDEKGSTAKSNCDTINNLKPAIKK